jgi:predicted metal-binding protein
VTLTEATVTDATATDATTQDATISETTAAGISADAHGPARPVAAGAITIYVCITCRGGQSLDLVPVPGEALAAATATAAAGAGIAVRPVRCLANCNRGLSAAVRRDGAWTYVFGGLDPAGGAQALVDGAKLFAAASDGLMPWRGRPDALKRGLVARTPPFETTGDRR